MLPMVVYMLLLPTSNNNNICIDFIKQAQTNKRL